MLFYQRLAIIAFQFAAGHSLGFGLTRVFGWDGLRQLTWIAIGAGIGVAVAGVVVVEMLRIPSPRPYQSALVTLAGGFIGALALAMLPQPVYAAATLPVFGAVGAFHGHLALTERTHA